MTFNFTRHTDGPGNTIFAADVNTVQIAVENLDFMDVNQDFAGLPTTGQVVMRHVFLGAASLPDNPNVSAVALTAGTVAAIYTVKKVSHGITTTVGTLTFAVSGSTTLSVAAVALSATTFAKDDVLTVTAPATVTGTPSNLAFGFRFLPYISAPAGLFADFTAMPGRIAHFDVSASGGTITNGSTGAISQLTDLSGNSNHATQGTTANQPLYITNAANGRPVARFDGSNDYFVMPSGFANWTGITVYMVAKNAAASPTTGTRYLEIATGTYANSFMLEVTSAQGSRPEKTDGAATFTTGATTANGWSQNVYHLNTYTEDSSGFGMMIVDENVTNISAYSYGMASSVTRTKNQIGTDQNLINFFNGDLCELIICNTVHSITERQMYGMALCTKWGIATAPAIIFPTKAATTIPANYFGIHLNHPDDGTSPASPYPTSTYGTYRPVDPYLWFRVNTAAATYTWTKLDPMFTANAGKRIIYTIGGTPTWASARPAEAGVFVLGDKAEPATSSGGLYTDLTTYINVLLDRYPGKIGAFECWNEPQFNFTGTTAALVQIAKTVWTAAKARDPSIVVLAPSWSYVSASATNLNDFLAAGGNQWCDGIAFHYYADSEQPERVAYLHRTVMNAARNNGLGAGVFWDTEHGWLSGSYSAAEQQGYPARAAILGWAMGLEAAILYSWDIRTTPITYTTTQGSAATTAAGAGWVTVYSWLVGKKMTGFSGTGTVYTVTLDDGSHIVWDTNTAGSTFTIPTAWGATQTTDLAGSVTALGGATTKAITVAPIKFS